MVSLSRIFFIFYFKDPAVRVDLRLEKKLRYGAPVFCFWKENCVLTRKETALRCPWFFFLERKLRSPWKRNCVTVPGFHHSLVSLVLMLSPHLHPPPHPSLASSSSSLTSHSAALLAKADILLLDEPTNHLDLHAVLWLESFLTRGGMGKAGEVATQKGPGTIVLVSHDRCFVENVATDVIVFEVCFFANRGILDKFLRCLFRATF